MAVALLAPVAACAPKRLVPATERPAPPSARQATLAGAFDDTLRAAGDPALAGSDSLPVAWLALLEQAGEALGPPVSAAGAPADSTAGGDWPGDQAAALAQTQVGKPYGWGGIGPERFDCSGLALYVYRQLGVALPRVSSDQASVGVKIDRQELKPGDLVFFSLRSAIDHVGIFLGDNRFVHAPRRREPVRVDTLDDAWWNRAYRGARRVFGGDP
ncbi:NlpC/P60 family protein [bacterium]|nr:NlpC/P60 family protein [bacterium]